MKGGHHLWRLPSPSCSLLMTTSGCVSRWRLDTRRRLAARDVRLCTRIPRSPRGHLLQVVSCSKGTPRPGDEENEGQLGSRFGENDCEASSKWCQRSFHEFWLAE